MPVFEKSLPGVIRRELRSLHIPPSLLGYHYLLHVVAGVILSPLRIKGITKGLYREIARLHATTPGAVERDIRTASMPAGNAAERKSSMKWPHTISSSVPLPRSSLPLSRNTWLG